MLIPKCLSTLTFFCLISIIKMIEYWLVQKSDSVSKIWLSHSQVRSQNTWEHSWAPICCLNCTCFHKLHRIRKAADIKRRNSGRNVVTFGMWRLPGMLCLRALLFQRAPSGPMDEQRAVLSAGFCSLKWVKHILNWKWHLSYSQTNIALSLLLFLHLPWCLSSTARAAQLFWYSFMG